MFKKFKKKIKFIKNLNYFFSIICLDNLSNSLDSWRCQGCSTVIWKVRADKDENKETIIAKSRCFWALKKSY